MALVILGAYAASCSPCERPFYDPSARQQDKTAPGLGQFNGLKGNAVGPRSPGWLLTHVSLIDMGQFDTPVRHVLNSSRAASDFGVIIPGWLA